VFIPVQGARKWCRVVGEYDAYGMSNTEVAISKKKGEKIKRCKLVKQGNKRGKRKINEGRSEGWGGLFTLNAVRP